MKKWIVNIKSYVEKCKRDHVGAFAAQAAFFIILSSIPFLMFLTSLLQYTPISKEYLTEVITESVPEYIEPFLISIVREVYTRNVGLLSVTAVLAVWAAGRAIQYMMAGLNVVHSIYETRNWVVVRLWSVIYTLGLAAVLILLLSIFVFADYLERIMPDNFGLITEFVRFRSLTRWVGIYALLCVFFTVLFAMLPNKKLTFFSQLPGGVICATAWYIFSFLLYVYVNFFHGFSMYGSMTTIALLMLWLYVCMYIMLLCAESNVFFAELWSMAAKKIRKK